MTFPFFLCEKGFFSYGIGERQTPANMKKILALVPFILFGCYPKDQTASPLCEVSLVSTVEEALKNPFFESGNWPKEAWWESFNNEDLAKIVQESLDHNPGYLAAKAQVEELVEQANVVYATLFPTVNFDGNMAWAYLGKTSPTKAPFPRNIHPTLALLTLNYEFDFWGKNRQQFESALGSAKTQEALYAQSKLILSVLAAETYFDLQAAMEKYDLYQHLLDDQKRLVQLTSLKMENGIESQFPFNSEQEQLAELEKNLDVIARDITLKKHALQKIMGRAVDENFTVKRAWQYEASPAKIPEFIGSDLLARRPDIMAKIWQVRSAQKLVGVAKAEFLPNINLNAGGGFFSFQYNKMFTSQSLVGFLMPSFSLPIFTAGKLTANLRAQMASYEQMIQEYNDLVLLAIQQVADQIAVYKSICKRLEEQAIKEELLYQDMQLIGLRVENGLDPLTNYLTARSSYLQEQTILVDLQREYYLASIELIKALGGGYLTDENASLCTK